MKKSGKNRKIFNCNFSSKNRKGVISEYLPWLLIAIAILVIVMISIFLLKGKGLDFIDSLILSYNTETETETENVEKWVRDNVKKMIEWKVWENEESFNPKYDFSSLLELWIEKKDFFDILVEISEKEGDFSYFSEIDINEIFSYLSTYEDDNKKFELLKNILEKKWQEIILKKEVVDFINSFKDKEIAEKAIKGIIKKEIIWNSQVYNLELTLFDNLSFKKVVEEIENSLK